jgi:site-specific DNA-methyltransferase (adenine-specific)
LAIRRHEELRAGLDPFRKTDAVPKAKNSHVKRLQKQRYVVSKKVLQLEVKRIAGELGHMPSREEVARLSSYPLEYYEKYFISWGEVCAAARTTGMSEYKEDDPRARKADHLPLFQESR